MAHPRCSLIGAWALLLLLAVADAAAAPSVRLRNGVQMPMIAVGTWQYNDTEVKASLAAAFEVGFTMVDTAYDYGNEEAVGEAIGLVDRKSVFVETKVPGCGFPGVSNFNCYNDTMAILELNLRKLNMSYVDLVIVHFPPRLTFLARTCAVTCDRVKEQWSALEDFYNAGKARAIGVSNYCPSCFKCLDSVAKVYPMVNQVMDHIGMGPDPSGIKSFCEEKEVALQAYSPLGNTPWRQGASPEILHGNFTSSLAAAHNKSTIAIALKYLVSIGVAVITKSGNPVHLAEDLDLWSWNLTAAEMAQANAYKLFGIYSFACNWEEDKNEWWSLSHYM